jgi:glycosyltransferase involved in cell wall biosynthesis
VTRDGEPRIAYLAGRYPAVSHTFILREARALRELGVDVQPFSIWRSRPEELLSAADRAEAGRTKSFLPLDLVTALGAQLAAVGASPGGYLRTVVRALRLARPGIRGALVGLSWVLEATMLWRECRERGLGHVHVHLNGTAPAVALLATEFANRLDGGRPAHTWSMTVHGPSEFYDVEGEALAEKVHSADFVACVSDFARSQLMAFVDEREWESLHVVHCGVEPAVHGGGRMAWDAPNGPLHVLTVGRLTQVKGQAVLIDAVSRLAANGTDVRLTIVGDGPKRGELERIAERTASADGRVRFTGAVSQDEIASYYESADVFALSSFAEGIPVVLMEAMAYGIPVVATRVMGVAELVDDGRSGLLVNPGRPDLMADAIARLAGDAELREAIGTAARAIVEQEFDVRRSAERLARLFDRYAQ